MVTFYAKSLKKLSERSIIGRLTIWFAASLTIIFTMATAFLYLSLSNFLNLEENAIIGDRVEAITNILTSEKTPLEALKKRVELEWGTRRSEHFFIKITSPQDGKVLVASPLSPPVLESEVFPLLKLNEGNAKVRGKRVKTSENKIFLGYAKKIQSTDPQINGAQLFLAFDLSSANTILTEYRNVFVGVLIIAALISIFLGIRLARLSFQPVESIIQTTRRIRLSSLHERIDENQLPSELKELAVTINEMLDRLGDSFDRLSRFSADLAHELRTPVNNIRGEIEVALNASRTNEEYKDILISSLEETQRISTIIDSLLFLARAENPASYLQFENLRLKDEVMNIGDYYQASAEEENIRFEFNIPDNLVLKSDRTLFQRALTNLFSNSINHSKKGGTIKVSAKHFEDHTEVIVEDTGAGIPKEALVRVFDRFYRADPSRTATKLGGFGLGLTIVQSVMKMHRGNVFIESQLGVGTKVVLRFPQGPSQDDKNVMLP